MVYKRDILQNFLKFTDKFKKQSFGGVLSKDALKNFAKFTEKQVKRKLQAGNLKLSETVTGDVQ